MSFIIKHWVSSRRHHLAYIIVACMISIMNDICSCFFYFSLQMFCQMALTKLVEFKRLNVIFDDSRWIIHWFWIIHDAIGMVAICCHLNTFVYQIFDCFYKMFNILIKIFVFEIVFILLKILKSMIDFVGGPEVNKHYSNWLKLLNKIKNKFVAFFVGSKCSTWEENSNEGRKLFGLVHFLRILV